jgi:hypothetical protein
MTTRWQDWAELVLGVWLFFSPWLLGYSDVSAAATNAHIIGAAIVVFSLIELYTWERWEEWINLVLGVWLIISPWVLGFNMVGRPTQNMVVLGILMIVLPLWAVGQQRARV